MNRALILAAGEAQRFGGVQKHLLSLGNETIIERIARQCVQRKVFPIIVTRERILVSVAQLRVGPTSTPCDTLLEAEFWWSGRTIVLLGDVIYSKAAMDTIVAETSDLAVFGNTFEILALTFSDVARYEVRAALEKARRHKYGKLRYFYKALIGVDMDCREVENIPLETEIFRMMANCGSGDWTRDIDTLHAWERFQIEVLQAGLLDDLHDNH